MKIIPFLESLPNAVLENRIFDKDELPGGYVHCIRYCDYEDHESFVKLGNEHTMLIKYDVKWCGDATKVDIFVKV